MSVGLLLAVALAATAPREPLTCDRDSLEHRSYDLTTRAAALVVTAERHDWWDSFQLGKYAADLEDLNLGLATVAERALEADPRNLMGHSILARQALILDEPEQAEAHWREVLAADGAVVWTATLYDVDARSWFFVAFDRRGIRLWRFGAVAERFEKGFYDIPKFPGPDDQRFWAASGGCPPPDLRPEAELPWSNVREIRAGNWVLWFELGRPITVTSDRGKRKDLREIKVNLHGRSGELEVYKPVGEDAPALRGRGPAGYQDAVRRLLVRLFDPEHRIVLPPLKPGAGW